jgi:hypothetical protein
MFFFSKNKKKNFVFFGTKKTITFKKMVGGVGTETFFQLQLHLQIHIPPLELGESISLSPKGQNVFSFYFGKLKGKCSRKIKKLLFVVRNLGI